VLHYVCNTSNKRKYRSFMQLNLVYVITD